jgi:transcriptional regulator with XRE-family HTH domain
VTAEGRDTSGSRQGNNLLREARLRTPSPNDHTRSMSQRELAEAIAVHVQRTTGREVALDRHVISRWERGQRRLPIAAYRAAFRAVLGAATDAELGFLPPAAFRPIRKSRRQTAAEAIADMAEAEVERDHQPESQG